MGKPLVPRQGRALSEGLVSLFVRMSARDFQGRRCGQEQARREGGAGSPEPQTGGDFPLMSFHSPDKDSLKSSQDKAEQCADRSPLNKRRWALSLIPESNLEGQSGLFVA